MFIKKPCPKPYSDEGKWQGFINTIKGDNEMTEPEIKQFNQLAAAAEEIEQTKICTKKAWIEIIGGVLSAQKNAFR